MKGSETLLVACERSRDADLQGIQNSIADPASGKTWHKLLEEKRKDFYDEVNPFRPLINFVFPLVCAERACSVANDYDLRRASPAG